MLFTPETGVCEPDARGSCALETYFQPPRRHSSPPYVQSIRQYLFYHDGDVIETPRAVNVC